MGPLKQNYNDHKTGKFTGYIMNNPCVFTIDDFMPKPLFDLILKGIREDDEHWDRANVVDTETGEATTDYRRTNQSSSLGYAKLPAACAFRDLAAATLRLHYTQAEELSVIKYDLGQEYAPHHDCFSIENLQKNRPEAGNRIFTALLYMTDVTEGGQTIFPHLGVEITPKANRCIFFSTTHTGTDKSLDLALHGSMPVIRGEKIAINLWFRANVYNYGEYQKTLDEQEKE